MSWLQHSYLRQSPTFLLTAAFIVAAANLMIHEEIVAEELTSSTPVAPADQPEELAEYMSTLQRYTHKLSLAINAGNTELAAFYMHESLAQLDVIQENFSEYETIPVALYVDRHGLSGYKPLKQLLKQEAPAPAKLSAAMDGVISSCNACHAASGFDFLKIKRNPNNPFLQDFSR